VTINLFRGTVLILAKVAGHRTTMDPMSPQRLPGEETQDCAINVARPAENLIDPVTLLAGCGGNAILFRKMTRSFQGCATEYLVDLRDALQRQDLARLGRTAHKLRGAASTFSTAIDTDIGSIEQLARSGESVAALALCATLMQRVGALCEALSRVSIGDLEEFAASLQGAGGAPHLHVNQAGQDKYSN
jgi:HPt (histidine-containing phosphotransfer) domain-containing protein